MLVEQTGKENYVRYRELTDGFKVPQKEADKLSSQINKNWWAKNKKQLTR